MNNERNSIDRYVHVVKNLYTKHGKDLFVAQKRRCPGCNSDKWTEDKRYNSLDVFDSYEILVFGYENLPTLVDYRCNNCGKQFGFWERDKVLLYFGAKKICRCGKENFVLIGKEKDLLLYVCKKCQITIGIDPKKLKNKKRAS